MFYCVPAPTYMSVRPKEIFDQYPLIFTTASLQISGYISVNEN